MKLNFFSFGRKNLQRRKTRTLLTALGVAAGAFCLFSILSFDRGFRRALTEEMQRSGAHLYVSTEGCPLEAASLILHGGEIPKFLPEERLAQVREVPGIHQAAGMLIFGVPNANIGNKVDLFYGVSAEMQGLRPYWKVQGAFPTGPAKIMLGAELAKVEKRSVGDKLFLEGLGQEFIVTGLLERTGTQDDSFYFLDLKAAQELFHKPGSLTAVAVGLSNLDRMGAVEQEIKRRMPDVYVVTETQMTSEIQKLVGGSRALITAVSLIAVLVALMGVLNTVLMSVFEMSREFGYMRCLGATRGHIFRFVLTETLLICAAGGVIGVVTGVGLSSATDGLLRAWLPYAPKGSLLALDPSVVLITLLFSLMTGAIAGLYPAYLAAKVTPMEAVRND